jgi:hypothetical protein
LHNHLTWSSDCILKIDGKMVGRFRLESKGWYVITRPAHDQRRFLFIAEEENQRMGFSKGDEGLIEAHFIPSEEASACLKSLQGRSRSFKRMKSSANFSSSQDASAFNSSSPSSSSSSSSSSSASSLASSSHSSAKARVGRTASGSNSSQTYIPKKVSRNQLRENESVTIRIRLVVEE